MLDTRRHAEADIVLPRHACATLLTSVLLALSPGGALLHYLQLPVMLMSLCGVHPSNCPLRHGPPKNAQLEAARA